MAMGYNYPSMELLDTPTENNAGNDYPATACAINEVFASFGVKARVNGANHGPAVTTYMIDYAPGVSIKKITGCLANIQYRVGSSNVRFSEPKPGQTYIGLEVPNSQSSTVTLRNFGGSWDGTSAISFGLGVSSQGGIVCDLAKMPHLLIAGSTGSGKSVCLNSIITSILFRAHPDAVKLVMIDPKQVELSIYDGIPHLATPVVKNVDDAIYTLQWACREMDNRYTTMSESGHRNIESYNTANPHAKYPQIVIIIDELADLMFTSRKEAEAPIIRLAQLGRAAGIHLVVATQRPTSNVITGLIKANMPARIAFAVPSSIDSRVILDQTGAEKLLGRGDMLYKPANALNPIRVQGCFVSDQEIERVVAAVKSNWTCDAKPIRKPTEEETVKRIVDRIWNNMRTRSVS